MLKQLGYILTEKKSEGQLTYKPASNPPAVVLC